MSLFGRPSFNSNTADNQSTSLFSQGNSCFMNFSKINNQETNKTINTNTNNTSLFGQGGNIFDSNIQNNEKKEKNPTFNSTFPLYDQGSIGFSNDTQNNESNKISLFKQGGNDLQFGQGDNKLINTQKTTTLLFEQGTDSSVFGQGINKVLFDKESNIFSDINNKELNKPITSNNLLFGQKGNMFSNVQNSTNSMFMQEGKMFAKNTNTRETTNDHKINLQNTDNIPIDSNKLKNTMNPIDNLPQQIISETKINKDQPDLNFTVDDDYLKHIESLINKWKSKLDLYYSLYDSSKKEVGKHYTYLKTFINSTNTSTQLLNTIKANILNTNNSLTSLCHEQKAFIDKIIQIDEVLNHYNIKHFQSMSQSPLAKIKTNKKSLETLTSTIELKINTLIQKSINETKKRLANDSNIDNPEKIQKINNLPLKSLLNSIYSEIQTIQQIEQTMSLKLHSREIQLS